MDEDPAMRLEDTTLSVYGKLPCYAEYIKIRCTDGPGRGFREWLDAAAQCGGTRLFTRWRAWSRRPGGEKVCATFRDSADAIGRSFPFSCHASGTDQAPLRSLEDELLDAAAVWEELEQWDAAIARERHLDAVRSVALGWQLHRGRSATASPESLEDVTSRPISELGCRLFPGRAPLEAWSELMWELRQALLRLRAMTGSTAVAAVAESRLPALRIPLAPGDDLLPQSWFWAKVLDENGRVVANGHGRVPPIQALAMPSRPVQHAAVWFFPRPLAACDYRALPLPASGVLQPVSAARAEDRLSGYSAFRSRLEKLLGHEEATVAELARFPLLP